MIAAIDVSPARSYSVASCPSPCFEPGEDALDDAPEGGGGDERETKGAGRGRGTGETGGM